ncbi:GntR family transcriptional regulator [Salinisphaera sp. T31B1]|uniref:GntR family transcriptional regulator n=1 Tax=Salinisphaera sp. T31B1 TaxID=727963 RepID=UPI003342BC4E
MATSSVRVYDHIRRCIASGEFVNGERLREEELAARYGVSRTPVRTALQRLANDGFVVMSPHAGAIVRGYNMREMYEIFEVRALLEPQAARLAATERTDAHLHTLERLCEQMEALGEARPPDYLQIAPLNNRFHQVVIEASGQRCILQIVNNLIELNLIMKSYKKFDESDLPRSFFEHRQLLNAITQREPELAGAIMRSHILAARANFLSETERFNADDSATV